MTSLKHLEPLLDGTPLAVERIKQVWPGLSTSERVYLLTVLLADTSNERKALRWSHHQEQLIDLALADTNAYVRYLAAKHVSAPYKADDAADTSKVLVEKARFKKVQTDPTQLVRSAEEEEGWKIWMQELDDPESFWKRPQTERLAFVNGVKNDGEKIAALLRYATKDLLPTGAITLDEMFDVLLQYLGGPSIAERVADSEDSSDGFAEYSVGKSVAALWEVIPDIPKALAYALLECLPEEAGFDSNMPLRVIKSLGEGQLAHLLWRNDITLRELRRKIYQESKDGLLRRAAISSQRFELLDSDISKLIYDPKESVEPGKKKIDELAELAENCQGATLAQLEAICGLISDAPTEFHSESGKWEAISSGKRAQTRRAKRLSPNALEREVLAMRLYTMAKYLAPIKSGDTPEGLPEKLRQHKDIVVPHNPWQTYLNLSKVVRLDRWKQTIGYLPSVHIRDINLPDDPDEDSDGDGDGDQERRLLFDLLKDVQGKVEHVSDKDRAELSALSKALSSISNQMQNVEAVTGKRVEVLQAWVQKVASTTNILVWLVGVMLLLVLFKSM